MGLTGQRRVTFHSDPECALREMHQIVSPYFVRAEPRLRALHYMLGISGVTAGAEKTRRSFASGSAESRTDGAQRLLTTARWDEMAVRARLGGLVKENSGPRGDLYVIETSFAKHGRSAVATEEQPNADSGRIEVCQNVVLMFYGVMDGCLYLIDADLYVSPSWLDDEERRRQVKIPRHLGYRSRSRIARDMIDRASVIGIEPDHVFLSFQCPDKPELLGWLHQSGVEHLAMLTVGEFRDLVPVAPTGMVVADWRTSSDTRAPYPMTEYYRVCSRQQLASYEMNRRVDDLRRMNVRWQAMRRQIGISRYEVRGWRGWHRHMTLAMAAQIAMELACHQSKALWRWPLDLRDSVRSK